MEPSQLQKLRNAIRSAFPPGRFLGEATECDCDECRYIADELRDRQWDELTNDFLDFTCGPTPLLSPVAFHTFLPAYMQRALDRPIDDDNNVAEWTTYSLSPIALDERARKGNMSDLVSRVSLMTPEQILVIRDFLKYVGNNSERLRDAAEQALRLVWTINSRPGPAPSV